MRDTFHKVKLDERVKVLTGLAEEIRAEPGLVIQIMLSGLSTRAGVRFE